MEPRTITARKLIREGRAKEAIAFIGRDNQTGPQQFSELLVLAEAHAKLGDLEKAETLYSLVVKRRPNAINVVRSYAGFLLDQERHSEAVNLIQALKNSTEPAAIVAVIDVMNRAGFPDEARKTRTRALSSDAFIHTKHGFVELIREVNVLDGSSNPDSNSVDWMQSRVETAITWHLQDATSKIGEDGDELLLNMLFSIANLMISTRKYEQAAGFAIQSFEVVQTTRALTTMAGNVPDILLLNVLERADLAMERNPNATSLDWIRIGEAHRYLAEEGANSISPELRDKAIAKATELVKDRADWDRVADLVRCAGTEVRAKFSTTPPDDLTFFADGKDGAFSLLDWQPLTEDKCIVWNGHESNKVALLFRSFTPETRVHWKAVSKAFAGHGYAAVLIRDPQRQIYINGFGASYPSRESTLASLKTALASKGFAQSLTFGLSAGGSAAISYGIELGSVGALAFSPLLRFPVPGETEEPRGHPIFRRVDAVQPPDNRNLTHLLKQHPDFACHIYHPVGENVDSAQAQQARDLDNVSLFSSPSHEHLMGVGKWTEQRWTQIIGQFLKDLPPGRT